MIKGNTLFHLFGGFLDPFFGLGWMMPEKGVILEPIQVALLGSVEIICSGRGGGIVFVANSVSVLINDI